AIIVEDSTSSETSCCDFRWESLTESPPETLSDPQPLSTALARTVDDIDTIHDEQPATASEAVPNSESAPRIAPIPRGRGALNAAARWPHGARIAAGSSDAVVIVWDAASGDELLVLRGHTSEVSAIAFSPDGKLLASAGQDRTIRLWEISTGRTIAVLAG